MKKRKSVSLSVGRGEKSKKGKTFTEAHNLTMKKVGK